MSNFESVKKFMKIFGQEIKEKAEFPNDKIISLRYELIREELEELRDALDKKDIKKIIFFMKPSPKFHQKTYPFVRLNMFLVQKVPFFEIYNYQNTPN